MRTISVLTLISLGVLAVACGSENTSQPVADAGVVDSSVPDAAPQFVFGDAGPQEQSCADSGWYVGDLRAPTPIVAAVAARYIAWVGPGCNGAPLAFHDALPVTPFGAAAPLCLAERERGKNVETPISAPPLSITVVDGPDDVRFVPLFAEGTTPARPDVPPAATSAGITDGVSLFRTGPVGADGHAMGTCFPAPGATPIEVPDAFPVFARGRNAFQPALQGAVAVAGGAKRVFCAPEGVTYGSEVTPALTVVALSPAGDWIVTQEMGGPRLVVRDGQTIPRPFAANLIPERFLDDKTIVRDTLTGLEQRWSGGGVYYGTGPANGAAIGSGASTSESSSTWYNIGGACPHLEMVQD